MSKQWPLSERMLVRGDVVRQRKSVRAAHAPVRRLKFIYLAVAVSLLPAGAHASAGGHLAVALHEEWQIAHAQYPTPGNPYLIVVDIRRQSLYLLVNGKRMETWPVSTAQRGVGNEVGSDQTPLGIFEIAGKFGAGLPEFAILSSRGPTGGIAAPIFALDHPAASAVMTTRILKLEGLQPGQNEGGQVDTLARHIYIHGTANLGMLGQPASLGCVQLAPGAVIALFHRVPVGTLVLITSDAATPEIPDDIKAPAQVFAASKDATTD